MKKRNVFQNALCQIKSGMENIKKKPHKNQIMIYVISFLLVVAGYLNYAEKNVQEVSSNDENILDEKQDTSLIDTNITDENESPDTENKVAESNSTNEDENKTEERNDENIGDARLVNSDDVTEKGTKDYFTNSKLERENMYSQMLENYQKILNNATISEEQKSIATQEIKNINNIKNAIMICENLITTKGFEDVVVFANGDSINVVVSAEKLSQEEIAQIQNIVTREMNSEIENIHIMVH